uniref:Microsomal glutathione S-transferase 3 n=1 Tax=Psilocybe cubensis TaxID=181762 RepID=A0A8H7XV40_PSICU
MAHTVEIPEGLGYVGASLVSVVFLLIGQSQVVATYRKKAGIAYPQLYAEKAEAEKSQDAHLFNCAQRAAQQTLEQMPIVLILSAINGFKYPILTAGTITLWTVSRISFTRGYITGDPKKVHD